MLENIARLYDAADHLPQALTDERPSVLGNLFNRVSEWVFGPEPVPLAQTVDYYEGSLYTPEEAATIRRVAGLTK